MGACNDADATSGITGTAQQTYELASAYRTQAISVATVLQMSVQPQAKVPLQEATLGSLQRYMTSGRFTCSDVVNGYVQART